MICISLHQVSTVTKEYFVCHDGCQQSKLLPTCTTTMGQTVQELKLLEFKNAKVIHSTVKDQWLYLKGADMSLRGTGGESNTYSSCESHL